MTISGHDILVSSTDDGNDCLTSNSHALCFALVAHDNDTAGQSFIADVHNVEENGRPSIAHTDITTSQFVFSNGRYKLNDFNRW